MNIETPEQTERRLAKHTADAFAAIFGLIHHREPSPDEVDEAFAEAAEVMAGIAQPIAPEQQP